MVSHFNVSNVINVSYFHMYYFKAHPIQPHGDVISTIIGNFSSFSSRYIFIYVYTILLRLVLCKRDRMEKEKASHTDSNALCISCTK